MTKQKSKKLNHSILNTNCDSIGNAVVLDLLKIITHYKTTNVSYCNDPKHNVFQNHLFSLHFRSKYNIRMTKNI